MTGLIGICVILIVLLIVFYLSVGYALEHRHQTILHQAEDYLHQGKLDQAEAILDKLSVWDDRAYHIASRIDQMRFQINCYQQAVRSAKVRHYSAAALYYAMAYPYQDSLRKLTEMIFAICVSYPDRSNLEYTMHMAEMAVSQWNREN